MKNSELLRDCIGILVICAIGLAYEIILTRMLSIATWYHFAFMVISVAMLGFGASGSFMLFIWNEPYINRRNIPEKMSGAFALSMLASLIFLSIVQMDLYQLSSNMKVWVYCSVLYLILALPFFCLGSIVTCLLAKHARQMTLIYGCDLIGAGLGCLIAIPLIHGLGITNSVLLLSTGALITSPLFAKNYVRTYVAGISAILLILCLVLFSQNRFFNIPAGPDKILSFLSAKSTSPHQYLFRSIQQSIAQKQSGSLAIDGPWPSIQILKTYWDKLCRIDVAAYPDFRPIYAIGAPTSYKGTIADQIMITQDGDAATFITRFDGDFNRLKYIDRFLYGLAYSFKKPAEVLVIGAGGGTDVLAALKNNAKSVVGIELNQKTVDVVRDEFSKFAGGIYSDPRVKIIVGEGRSQIRRANQSYDLIQMTGVDTWAASQQGAYVLSENYLYTVEAFSDYYDHLNDDGILSIVRARFVRPRESLRLCSLGIEMLRRKGISNPGSRMIVVTESVVAPNLYAGFLLKKGVFTQQEINSIQSFCDVSGFKIAGGPGAIVSSPFSELLSTNDPSDFYNNYPYDITPVTDAQPYFFKLHKWNQLHVAQPVSAVWGIDLGARPGSGDESGMGILIFLLIQAGLLSFLLIMLPVIKIHRIPKVSGNYRSLAYFGFIGVGFMFLEIALIHKFSLFLEYPSRSLSVVLLALLSGSGVGSILSGRIVLRPILWIRIFSSLLPAYFASVVWIHFRGDLLTWPVFAKSLLIYGIAGFAGMMMGCYFPLAVRSIGCKNQILIPWAWAINGCASVIGSIMATIVSMTWGLNMVLLLGSAGYICAGVLAHSVFDADGAYNE